jgi:hypothetical protein
MSKHCFDGPAECFLVGIRHHLPQCLRTFVVPMDGQSQASVSVHIQACHWCASMRDYWTKLYLRRELQARRNILAAHIIHAMLSSDGLTQFACNKNIRISLNWPATAHKSQNMILMLDLIFVFTIMPLGNKMHNCNVAQSLSCMCRDVPFPCTYSATMQKLWCPHDRVLFCAEDCPCIHCNELYLDSIERDPCVHEYIHALHHLKNMIIADCAKHMNITHSVRNIL